MGNDEGTRGWRICLDASDAEAYAALASDRVWHCFALADLLPPFRSDSQIALAQRDDPIRRAACLVLRHPELSVVSPSGDAEGIAALLEQLDLPTPTLIQAQATHLPTIERFYRPQIPWQEMLRMSVTLETCREPVSVVSAVERLTATDLYDLMVLYQLYPEGHFRPDLLEHGLFFGVREGKQLLAAGGTHVLADAFGLAVLGNVFTRPEARNRGYATMVVSALVRELFERGISDVVLNVSVSNHVAVRVYEHLGFAPALRYLTGLASTTRTTGKNREGRK